jgi:hypothetical protein
MIKKLVKLSPKEDAAVTKAATSDANARPLTNAQWNKVKQALTRGPAQILRKSVKDFQE